MGRRPFCRRTRDRSAARREGDERADCLSWRKSWYLLSFIHANTSFFLKHHIARITTKCRTRLPSCGVLHVCI